jgi:NAD-dependent DNA ligase
MTWAKATNEITGLLRGLLADGVVTESEAAYLRNWLTQRPELLRDPLVASLGMRLDRIFADGVVTPEELEELKTVCMQFTPQDDAPTSLPLDTPPPTIVIPHHAFCFTGTFVSGTRTWCEEQVISRAGVAHGGFKHDTDFLVIGTKVSAAWVNQSYGRKIQAAADAKRSGHKVFIVNEEHWLSFLT